MDIREIQLRPVEQSEESRYQELMSEHHYLGALAQNQRNHLVSRTVAEPMGGASELFRRCMEVRGT